MAKLIIVKGFVVKYAQEVFNSIDCTLGSHSNMPHSPSINHGYSKSYEYSLNGIIISKIQHSNKGNFNFLGQFDSPNKSSLTMCVCVWQGSITAGQHWWKWTYRSWTCQSWQRISNNRVESLFWKKTLGPTDDSVRNKKEMKCEILVCNLISVTWGHKLYDDGR